MKNYLLNLSTGVLETLPEIVEAAGKSEELVEKEVLTIAQKYKDAIVKGKKFFSAIRESAKYRVTCQENEFYIDRAESDERIQFSEAYQKNKFGIGDYSYGYVEGERYLVSNTAEQIAAFIMEHKMKLNIRIVNAFDTLELSTSMGFIDYCGNQDFLKLRLLPVLIPMQQGEVEILAFTPHTDEKYMIRNVRERSNEGKYFLSNLNHIDGVESTKISEYFETEELLAIQYPDSISLDEAYNLALERELI